MSEGVQHNLDRLNRGLREYRNLSGKPDAEILEKQGGKLGFALRQRLKGLSPAKGATTRERLAALKSGEGVRVRDRVATAVMAKHNVHGGFGRYRIGRRRKIKGVAGLHETELVGSIVRKGKRLNLQALMVQRELKTRESGRQFLSISARYPRVLKKQQYAKSAFGPILSSAGISNDGASMTFHWDPKRNQLQGSAAAGLSKPRARAVIALALRDTATDIAAYNSRKNAENARKAGFRV